MVVNTGQYGSVWQRITDHILKYFSISETHTSGFNNQQTGLIESSSMIVNRPAWTSFKSCNHQEACCTVYWSFAEISFCSTCLYFLLDSSISQTQHCQKTDHHVHFYFRQPLSGSSSAYVLRLPSRFVLTHFTTTNLTVNASRIVLHLLCTKPGIHLRQRQAEMWHSSFSSASVDVATNQAICLPGCHNPSRVVGRSKWGKSEEFPSSCAVWTEHAAPRRNWKIFFSTRHSTPRHAEDATLWLASASSVFPAL